MSAQVPAPVMAAAANGPEELALASDSLCGVPSESSFAEAVLDTSLGSMPHYKPCPNEVQATEPLAHIQAPELINSESIYVGTLAEITKHNLGSAAVMTENGLGSAAMIDCSSGSAALMTECSSESAAIMSKCSSGAAAIMTENSLGSAAIINQCSSGSTAIMAVGSAGPAAVKNLFYGEGGYQEPVEIAVCGTGGSAQKQEHVISVGPKDEAQLIDFNKLKYYTIAENVLVETIDLPDTAEDSSNEQHHSSDVELVDLSSDEGENARRAQKSSKKAAVEQRKDAVWLDGAWGEEDKARLLRALNAHGSSDMELLAAQIPGKTPADIQMAVKYYRSLAADSMTLTARELRRLPARRPRVPHDVTVPLVSWRRALAAPHGSSCPRTVLADALRIIARCEYAPAPEDTSNVDFPKLYHVLADAMDGRPHAPVSSESAAALRRALTEVALSSKYLQAHGYGSHLQRPPPAGAGGGGAGVGLGVVGGGEAQLARSRLGRLLGQPSYNPLRVPESLCKTLKCRPY